MGISEYPWISQKPCFRNQDGNHPIFWSTKRRFARNPSSKSLKIPQNPIGNRTGTADGRLIISREGILLFFFLKTAAGDLTKRQWNP